MLLHDGGWRDHATRVHGQSSIRASQDVHNRADNWHHGRHSLARIHSPRSEPHEYFSAGWPTEDCRFRSRKELEHTFILPNHQHKQLRTMVLLFARTTCLSKRWRQKERCLFPGQDYQLRARRTSDKNEPSFSTAGRKSNCRRSVEKIPGCGRIFERDKAKVVFDSRCGPGNETCGKIGTGNPRRRGCRMDSRNDR